MFADINLKGCLGANDGRESMCGQTAKDFRPSAGKKVEKKLFRAFAEAAKDMGKVTEEKIASVLRDVRRDRLRKIQGKAHPK